jgi:hypothetical protein
LRQSVGRPRRRQPQKALSIRHAVSLDTRWRSSVSIF